MSVWQFIEFVTYTFSVFALGIKTSEKISELKRKLKINEEPEDKNNDRQQSAN